MTSYRSSELEKNLSDNDHNYHNKQHRHLRIGYQPNQAKGLPKPQLKLSGQWLASCGFTTGRTVQIATAPGKIIITLINSGDEEISPTQTPIS